MKHTVKRWEPTREYPRKTSAASIKRDEDEAAAKEKWMKALGIEEEPKQ